MAHHLSSTKNNSVHIVSFCAAQYEIGKQNQKKKLYRTLEKVNSFENSSSVPCKKIINVQNEKQKNVINYEMFDENGIEKYSEKVYTHY